MVTRLPGDANESMGPSSVNEAHDRDGRSPNSAGTSTGPAESLSTAELLEQLQADRAWLLQQIDGGSTAELIPREQRVAAAIRVDQGDDAPR